MWVTYFAVASAIPLLADCGMGQNLFKVDAAAIRSDYDQDMIEGSEPPPPINLDTFVFHEQFIPTATFDLKKGWVANKLVATPIKTAYAAAADGTETETTRHAARNRLQDNIRTRSDEMCDFHKNAILANKSVFDLSTSVLSAILGTTSSVVGGGTARFLGAASGAVSSTDAAVTASIYQNLFAAAIIREIDRSRQEFLENKVMPNRKASTTDYTAEQAILDINEYHMKCSFYRGVIGLTKETKIEPMTRQEILAEIEVLEKKMKELESIFNKSAEDGKVKESEVKRDAKFTWDVYSARKKQLSALLVDPRTSGRVQPK